MGYIALMMSYPNGPKRNLQNLVPRLHALIGAWVEHTGAGKVRVQSTWSHFLTSEARLSPSGPMSLMYAHEMGRMEAELQAAADTVPKLLCA